MGFIEQIGTVYQEWGIRVVVLLSLLFQVLLQLLGNRRKFSRSLWLRIIVWCSYVSADSIVTFALGMISTKLVRIGDLSHLDGETKLNVLWAPCMLVLLGGPDSITAYSVEDNELWLRHVFGLVTQTLFTGYLCISAWAADYPSYLSFALLVVGVVKYGERVWVLWQVSFDKLRDEQYSDSTRGDWAMMLSFDDNELFMGYVLSKVFKHIFLSQKLDTSDRATSLMNFSKLTHQKAFKLIEIELGFMYDLLHTKAKTTYTCRGICRRLITPTISFIVLVVFSEFVNKKTTKDDYPRIDVVVTIVLLSTNILLEIYWVCMFLSSDWAEVLWSRLTSNKDVVHNTHLKWFQQPRWSNSAGQLSFFSLFPFVDNRLLKRLHLHDKVGPYYYAKHQEITDDIKHQILIMIQKVDRESHNRASGETSSDNKQLFLNYRELLKYACTDICPAHLSLDDELLKEEYDFANCITIWHVATELCYSCDHDNSSLQEALHSDERNAAMLLSRYMFYILVRYPSMLQTVNRKVELKYFRDEIHLKNPNWVGELRNAKSLLEAMPNKPYRSHIADRAPAHNYVACKLAKKLMIDGGENTSNPWRFLLNSWLAHLLYAAYNCREEYHTQQLRRGGEFLTHVWMLLVHLGLTNHFQSR